MKKRLLNLLNGSRIAKSKTLRDRTVPFCENLHDFMESFRIDPVGKLLGSFDIRDFKKSVIMHTVIDIFLLRLTCKKVVPVHIELQPKCCPGRNTQITQAKFFIHEIKVIMETFALVKFQECLTC